MERKKDLDHTFIGRVEQIGKLLKSLNIIVPSKTAERYTRVLLSIGSEKEDMENIIGGIFKSDYDGMIIEKNIPIYSYCEHHVLPWFGQVHIGYLAVKRVVGISKFTRIVNYYSSGVTIQEDVTKEITDFFCEKISPDVAVMVEAIHTCKVARGVENPFSKSVTIDMRGKFREFEGPRSEFLHMLGMNNH